MRAFLPILLVLLSLAPAAAEESHSTAALLQGLHNSNPAVRYQAASELGFHQSDAAATVPALAAALKDADASVRNAAASSLGHLGPAAASAVGALQEALRDPQVVVGALQALTFIGPAARTVIPAIVAVTRDTDATKRGYAVEALGYLGAEDQGALTAVTTALRDPQPTVRVKAAMSAVRLGTDAAKVVPVLTECLRNGEAMVRGMAAAAMAELGTLASDGLPALQGLLSDADASVRMAAALAVWRVSGQAQQSIPVLTKLLSDSATRLQAIEILGHMGADAKPAFSHLGVQLLDRSEVVRVAAADAMTHVDMANLDKAGVVAVLIPLLRSSSRSPFSPLVRVRAAFVLWRLGDASGAIPALVANLKDADVDVRMTSAATLLKLDPNNTAALDVLRANMSSIMDALASIADNPPQNPDEMEKTLFLLDMTANMGGAAATAKEILRQLTTGSPLLPVREAALRALQAVQSK